MESDFDQPNSSGADPSLAEPAVEISNADETHEADGQPKDDAKLTAASEPYVGRWNRLISSTNWEKGRIIAEWREKLIQDGAPATEYSDEAWARRVGGVTAPHVGRLRRVFEEFGEQQETYPGLFWSHFLAAMDWDDAPLWLEGAMRSGWSVSKMRRARWEANGSPADADPSSAELISADLDEDVVMPAQGGGSEGRYDQEPEGVSAGPLPEGPDFGEEPVNAAADRRDDAESGNPDNLPGPESQALVQPFSGLPDLPDDLTEALEMFKLAIIRHKASGWEEVAPETVHQALDGLKILVNSRVE